MKHPILVLAAALLGIGCDAPDPPLPCDEPTGTTRPEPVRCETGADCPPTPECLMGTCFGGICTRVATLLTSCGEAGVCYNGACCEGSLENTVVGTVCVAACGGGEVDDGRGLCVRKP